ncbi:hypothetical protein PV326_006250 [Microctonus aethiopoides]|nr:hypothetical protein PV326_006250 [Microctonus aethiopoides]
MYLLKGEKLLQGSRLFGVYLTWCLGILIRKLFEDRSLVENWMEKIERVQPRQEFLAHTYDEVWGMYTYYRSA